jgi:KRAB domain-containing zinc finger protein
MTHRCDVCDKSFTRRSTLNKQMTIHTGEKIQKCKICDKSVSQRGHLNQHMEIHTGKRNHIIMWNVL